MADFFKPEDFKEVTGNWTREELANFCNLKIVSKFESNDYKPQQNEIELYCLVDTQGRILYTGYSEKAVQFYKENNLFTENSQVVKLTGQAPERNER